MAFKVDLSGVKNFFFEKGEKVALVACLLGMGGLVAFGVLSGMGAGAADSSGRSFSRVINDAAQNIQNKVKSGEEIQSTAATIRMIDWASSAPGEATRLFDLPDKVATKRLNPRTLPILASPQRKEIQMDYLRGTVLAFDLNHAQQTIEVFEDAKAPNQPMVGFPMVKGLAAGKKTYNPTIVTKPTRMVVVHAVFPMREQLVEFQRAFRTPHLYEVFQSKDLPKILGMNVWKAEVIPGQKETHWTPLVYFNPKTEKLEVDPALRKVLRESFFDDETVAYFAPFLMQGLATPLPKLAILPHPNYPMPEVELNYDWVNDPLKIKEGGAVGAGMPAGFKMQTPAMPNLGMMGKGPGIGGRAEAKFEQASWRYMTPDLQEKFKDNTYVLDPMGINVDPEDLTKLAGPGGAAGIVQPNYTSGTGATTNPYAGNSPFSPLNFWQRYPAPPTPVQTGVGIGPMNPNPLSSPPLTLPGQSGQPALNIKPYDALVRFFDPSVRPGKTYKYMVQVRLANPNYNKKAEVAYPSLADIKELPPSPPVETPTISIPEEFFLYAVDQKPDKKIPSGSDTQDAKPDQVAVQVHRWIDETYDPNTGFKYVLGDWAIAERLLVKRGQPVGRVTNVEVPIWRKDKNTFEIGLAIAANKEKEMKNPPKSRPTPKGKEKDKEGPEVELGARGIPVDFSPTNPPPVLVDFDGGRRTSVRINGTTISNDESMPTLLIMNGDGTLFIRDARTDSDADSAQSVARQKRIDEWKTKILPFLGLEVNPANPNPGVRFPGLFPGMKKN